MSPLKSSFSLTELKLTAANTQRARNVADKSRMVDKWICIVDRLKNVVGGCELVERYDAESSKVQGQAATEAFVVV